MTLGYEEMPDCDAMLLQTDMYKEEGWTGVGKRR